MKKYSEIFFSSFNLSMRAAYDSCIKTTEERAYDSFADTDSESLLEACLDNEYKRWLSEQLPGTARTPSEYLDEVGFDEITEMFCYGTEICDDELPAILNEKLLSYGDKAIDFLIKTAAGTGNISDSSEEEIARSVMAARLLGRYKTQKAVLPLIDIIEKSRGASELMQQTARDALTNIGQAAVSTIIQEMSSGKRSEETCEYLAMSLAEIGKDSPSDEIYSALKNVFNMLSDKVVAAACLAKYGDGRAIPALRGYLQKSGESISREAFYDIVSAVRQLGGRIDDLKQVRKR